MRLNLMDEVFLAGNVVENVWLNASGMSDWAAGARESGDGGAEEARFVRAAIAEGSFLMLYMCEFDVWLMIASNAFLQQKPLGPSTSKSEEDTPEGILCL